MTEAEYDHAGTWDCEACGEQFDVEHKLEVLSHVFACGSDSPTSAVLADTTVTDAESRDSSSSRRK